MKALVRSLAIILMTLSMSQLGCKKGSNSDETLSPEPKAQVPEVKMAKYTYTIGTELTATNRNSFQGKSLVDKDILYMVGTYGTDRALLMIGYKADTSIVMAKKFTFPRSTSFVDNVISDGAGGFIIAGRYDRGYLFVARLNAAGVLQWSKTVTDTKNSIYTAGTDMYVVPGISEVKDGKFAIFYNEDILLFDTGGTVMWRVGTHKTYRGVLTGDGVLAFGQRSGDNRLTIKKLDMQGKLLWSRAAANAPNANMAFGKPLVLADRTILLSYLHKSLITAESNYGLLNITEDGSIRSDKLYLAAPIQPDRDNRPAEMHRKSDGKIWFHFPGRRYLMAGQSEALEVGFNLNENGTVDESGFFQGKSTSFGFANNKVISINESEVTVGSLAGTCASPGNKVNVQDAFLKFGAMNIFIEVSSVETFSVNDYPFEITDAGIATISVRDRCR
jgi:hypothetical protein